MKTLETKKDGVYTITRQFNGVHELAEYCDDMTAEKVASFGHECLSSVNNSASFSDGVSYSEAVDMGHKGGRWEAGARDIAALEIAADKMFKQGSRGEVVPALVGASVSVPRYLSSNPRAMRKTVRKPIANKTVKLAVDVGASASVPTSYMYNKGAAVLSYVKALELKGYSVLVDVFSHSVATRHKAKNKYNAIAIIRVKEPSVRMTAADIAYPIAHSAFFRRLIFRTIETAGEAAAPLCKDCYGYVAEEPDVQGYDGVVAGMYADDKHNYSTLERALSTVKISLDNQLAKKV